LQKVLSLCGKKKTKKGGCNKKKTQKEDLGTKFDNFFLVAVLPDTVGEGLGAEVE